MRKHQGRCTVTGLPSYLLLKPATFLVCCHLTNHDEICKLLISLSCFTLSTLRGGARSYSPLTLKYNSLDSMRSQSMSIDFRSNIGELSCAEGPALCYPQQQSRIRVDMKKEIYAGLFYEFLHPYLDISNKSTCEESDN